MTRRREEAALATMRAANPASAAELRDALADGELQRELRRAIAVGRSPAHEVPRLDFTVRRRRVALGFGTALACAAAAAALLLLAGGSVGGGGQPAFAAAAVEVAEANPRLLVTAPGWEVTRADEFEASEGEMSFGDGTHSFDVRWYPAGSYGRYLRDRAGVSTPEQSTLLGRTATTVHYGREEYATMLAPQGSVFVEVRGSLGSRAAYDALLDTLRPVDVDTWLAAMPPSVVGPEDRAAALEEALRGVPLPPGFDRAALEREDAVRDRYQFAAQVTGAVACGWVESWLAARRSGDDESAAAAVEAMSTWPSWHALQGREMERGWAQNIKHTAAEIEQDSLKQGAAGSLVRPDGSGYEMGPAWATALGCTSHYWRRPLTP